MNQNEQNGQNDRNRQTRRGEGGWSPYYRRNPDGTPGGAAGQSREGTGAARGETGGEPEVRRRMGAVPCENERQAENGAPAQCPASPQSGGSAPAGRHAAAERAPGQNAPRGAGHTPAGAGKEQKPRKQMSLRSGRLLFLAAMLAVLVIVVVIGAIALLRSRGGNNVTYYYDYDGVYTAKISAAQAAPADVPYLNMNYIAGVYGMTVSGSYEDMKFSTSDGEWIAFIPGSRTATVNGTPYTMKAAAVLTGAEMWIPVSAVTELFDGVSVEWDVEGEKYKHTVLLHTEKDSDGKTRLPLTFALRPSSENPPEETVAWEDGYEYLTDMTPFKDAITPADRDAYLILANKENPLPTTYVPTDLVTVTNIRSGYPVQRMMETAELALQALYQDMIAAGFTDVGVTSGYRSYATQNYLFEKYVAEEMQAGITRAEAEEKANTYSARPGESEHQTGLAVDMYNTPTISEAFADTEAYAWLLTHAHQYGFILRYPKEKENITGYIFEPWHYRFVGRYHATKIYESGMVLEEYLEQLNR